MFVKGVIVLFLLGFYKQVLALKCYNCFDIVSELHDKNDCYYPKNGTTPTLSCPSKCYLFQWGEPFLHDNTVFEIYHTVRSCEPPTWEQCDPNYGRPYRKHHCITCDTDLCNTSSQLISQATVCVFLLSALALFLS